MAYKLTALMSWPYTYYLWIGYILTSLESILIPFQSWKQLVTVRAAFGSYLEGALWFEFMGSGVGVVVAMLLCKTPNLKVR
jgi:hypothetical protein